MRLSKKDFRSASASKDARLVSVRSQRKRIKRIKSEVNRMAADPWTNIPSLLLVQRLIVVSILRTEKRMKRLKAERLRLHRMRGQSQERVVANELKRRIALMDSALDQAKHLLWIWRCLGDCIPFAYLDKWSLKHMIYSAEDYSIKQPPGDLSANEGRHLELAIMTDLCKRGFPAALCDITNTLRHGDVCVLVGPDPYPIEVKSSANSNARTSRQARNLLALHDFYSSDKAENFRGLPQVRREEMPRQDPFVVELNAVLAKCRGLNIVTASPEPGLTYVALRKELADDEDGPRSLGGRLMFYVWNQALASGLWPPHYPFALTISSAADLAAFVEGMLGIMVVLDTDEVVRRFEAVGLRVTFVDDDQVGATVARIDPAYDQAGAGISKQMLMRVFLECDPISNLLNPLVRMLEIMEAMPAPQPEMLTGRDYEMTRWWTQLRPIFQ